MRLISAEAATQAYKEMAAAQKQTLKEMQESQKAAIKDAVEQHAATCPAKLAIYGSKRLLVGVGLGMAASAGGGGVLGAMIGKLLM